MHFLLFTWKISHLSFIDFLFCRFSDLTQDSVKPSLMQLWGLVCLPKMHSIHSGKTQNFKSLSFYLGEGYVWKSRMFKFENVFWYVMWTQTLIFNFFAIIETNRRMFRYFREILNIYSYFLFYWLINFILFCRKHIFTKMYNNYQVARQNKTQKIKEKKNKDISIHILCIVI